MPLKLFSVNSLLPLPSLTRRGGLFVAGAFAFVYALAVLVYVQTIPDIGVRSAFSPVIKGIPRYADDAHPKPRAGDRVVQVEGIKISTWSDLLNAPFTLDGKVAEGALRLSTGIVDKQKSLLVRVRVIRTEPGKAPHEFTYLAPLGTLPAEQLVPSVLWFSLSMMLFMLAGLVFWNRPSDKGAAQFFLLCSVTLVAYMGGYHWPQIVNQFALLTAFMVCSIFVPAVCLHFYLIFPSEKHLFSRYRRWWLLLIYGIPFLFLCTLFTLYFLVRRNWQFGADPRLVAAQLVQIRDITFVYFGVAAVWYLSCVASLMHSYWTVSDATQKSQVRSILYGALLATVPIGYSLYLVIWNMDAFASGGATWPMFAASMFLNMAFAISMVRYRLMELDKIISSGFGYFLISFFAALIYFAVVFIGTVLFNQVIASPKLSEALTVSTTALLLIVALDLLRSQFRKVLDRRFHRDKSRVDEILQQMGQAVEHLVDPPALAHRMLRTSTELLGVSRGAVYLCQSEPTVYVLAGAIGDPPPLDELPPGAPLIDALKNGGVISARNKNDANPAQRQLLFLGGEVAHALCHEGHLLAVLILGDKETPYRNEDMNLLAAFTQVTALALQSAGVNRTIETLNHELQTKVDKIGEQQRRILALQTQLRRQNMESRDADATPAFEPPPPTPNGIVGSSPVVRQLLHVVRQVAVTEAVVLIRGESGTGKELVARAVHDNSERADKPFVKVHCAALSPGLLESELFGHVKGAFTGAHQNKLGRFELAHGGTLLLDEIGDINLEVQTKLLRVLQEKTIERVGSSEPITVDVRIIAATHQNLEKLIQEGRFREDLFYRLNVFPIRVSPLRERPEDIPELAMFFVELSAQRCRKEVLNIDDDVLSLLKAYPWPGNIRQLENVIERAVVIAEGPVLTTEELPAELVESVRRGGPPLRFGMETHAGVPRPLRRMMSPTRAEREQQERDLLVRAMAEAAGNKAEAARALGLARSTLLSRLKKHGLT